MKKHLKEMIVIGVILLASIISSCLIFIKPSEGLCAKIYKDNDLLMYVDLSKEEKERVLDIKELHNLMTIEVKHNAIRVKDSTCPRKDCVSMGYVSLTMPIICAYHKVLIDIYSLNGESDVII